jgi:hypothetical protein
MEDMDDEDEDFMTRTGDRTDVDLEDVRAGLPINKWSIGIRSREKETDEERLNALAYPYLSPSVRIRWACFCRSRSRAYCFLRRDTSNEFLSGDDDELLSGIIVLLTSSFLHDEECDGDEGEPDLLWLSFVIAIVVFRFQ